MAAGKQQRLKLQEANRLTREGKNREDWVALMKPDVRWVFDIVSPFKPITTRNWDNELYCVNTLLKQWFLSWKELPAAIVQFCLIPYLGQDHWMAPETPCLFCTDQRCFRTDCPSAKWIAFVSIQAVNSCSYQQSSRFWRCSSCSQLHRICHTCGDGLVTMRSMHKGLEYYRCTNTLCQPTSKPWSSWIWRLLTPTKT